MEHRLRVFAGRASRYLAEAICRHLAVPLGEADVFKFSNDNTFVRISENVRGRDVFVVQTSCPPVDENLMELLILVDALKRASAERITAVLPLYPYARSDKKDQPRVAITAKLVADLITAVGVSRVITVDLHSAQIQGFFNIPLDHLTAITLLEEYFRQLAIPNPVVVATDTGGARKAGEFARRLGAPVAIGDKHRLGNSERVEITHFIGEVAGHAALVFDDEVDTASTLCEAVRALSRAGARSVYAACTHPVFSGPAVQRLAQLPLVEMVVTDTVPLPPEKRFPALRVLPVAPLMAEAIKRVHLRESITPLFT